ncbi:phosphonate metabolism protein PhnP [Lonsdalea quercina]|uniref:phosphonate metabolism protein PhnP n=1 Tax=Lonsdalea quercina TaxID=71657 RepID=UPI003974FD56
MPGEKRHTSIFHFLGTGGAQQVPAFGCDCTVCRSARTSPQRRRRACCAALIDHGETTLIDAGLPNLERRFSAGEIRRFLLTHYHMDHVQGLFPLRWGCGEPIPVFGPPDPDGCDDLYKHPGILQFQPPLKPFETVAFGRVPTTPLPLNHSRMTYGYLFETQFASLAYLTDTVDLPEDTARFLAGRPVDYLVLDCSEPPQPMPPRNHNDLTLALDIFDRLKPGKMYLTHIGHTLDRWLQAHALPKQVQAAYDGLRLKL